MCGPLTSGRAELQVPVGDAEQAEHAGSGVGWEGVRRKGGAAAQDGGSEPEGSRLSDWSCLPAFI